VMANNQWMASSAHRAAILSTSYNYMGVGLAVDTVSHHRIWTAVFLKSPDHTGGWVKMNPLPTDATMTALAGTRTVASRSVKVSWAGGDVRLPVLTSGFDHFQIMKRYAVNSWSWVTTSTTGLSRTLTVYSGHVYRLAVRACDHRGNCGTWAYATVNG
jgi:hypothetical protein